MSKTINVRLKLEDYEEKALNLIKGNIITESDSDAVRFAIKRAAKAIVSELGMKDYVNISGPIPKNHYPQPELPTVNDATGDIDYGDSKKEEVDDINIEVDPGAEGYRNPLYREPKVK